MKLIIRRSQEDKKGMFGGNKGIVFKTLCSAVLSQEELEVLDRAKAMDYPVWERTRGPNDVVRYSVQDLTRGVGISSSNVGELLSFEASVKDGCQGVSALISVISSFGGEEVIEIG